MHAPTEIQGDHMRMFRAASAIVVLALAGAFLQTAPASADPPDAEVHILAQAFQGQHDTILASLRARCAPGFEFADLVIDFQQGAMTSPSTHGASLPCDGTWHRQHLSSLEGFGPGPATM